MLVNPDAYAFRNLFMWSRWVGKRLKKRLARHLSESEITAHIQCRHQTARKVAPFDRFELHFFPSADVGANLYVSSNVVLVRSGALRWDGG